MMINNPPVKGRSCGSCNRCCIDLEITELNKAIYTPCQHLCTSEAGACGIYNERPSPCSNFQCLWLAGYIGGEMHRPDKCGIMWTESKGEVFQAWLDGEPDEKQQYMLNKIAKSIVFILRKANGKPRSLMGPRGAVKKFLEKRGLWHEGLLP